MKGKLWIPGERSTGTPPVSHAKTKDVNIDGYKCRHHRDKMRAAMMERMLNGVPIGVT